MQMKIDKYSKTRISRRIVPALAILFAALISFSCATKLQPIADNITSSELIQKAQERSDNYDWKGAQYYYKALLEKFGDNPELVVTAMYELAFIEYKQGRMDSARAGFEAVLAKYAAPEGQSLTQTWKILSEKVLEKLPKPTSK
jgi:outer membrane protein assembly factor BamD (BamD/ComL family)